MVVYICRSQANKYYLHTYLSLLKRSLEISTLDILRVSNEYIFSPFISLLPIHSPLSPLFLLFFIPSLFHNQYIKLLVGWLIIFQLCQFVRQCFYSWLRNFKQYQEDRDYLWIDPWLEGCGW